MSHLKIPPAAILGLCFAGFPGLISPALAQCVTVGADVTCTNSGTLGNGTNLTANTAIGNATVNNSGSIGSGSTVVANTAIGNSVLNNSGSIGAASTVTVNTAIGNSTLNNSGSIGASSTIAVNTAIGNSILTNTGSIGAGSTVSVNTAIGDSDLRNLGSIGANVTVNTAIGNATVTNAGFIAGNVLVNTAIGNTTLTNLAGSRIAGSITLGGGNRTLEFIGGNYLYTVNSLAGVNINTHGAPFVVSGNSVAVLDPTVLALEDRSLMNFTGGVSSMLQDRFGGMGVPGGAGRAAPLSFAPSFAPDTAARLDAAHDAFAGIPSLSMSYASDDSRVRNANAAYLKAPVAAVPVYDTVVWASGFGGERRQSGFDTVLPVRDTAYGGAFGVDRQFTPDLRLGLFAGGGASNLRTAFNVQGVDSEYGFAGGYGRWDRRDYFVDFALFGGGLSSKSTRQVANNLVANGLEIATARYDGWFISPDVTIGYRMFNPLGTVTPKARVRYVGGTLDGYTETGSAQGLVVGARNISDIEERLGIEFAMITAFAGGGTIRSSVEFSGLGLHRLGDSTINTVLLAQNLAFTTPGRRDAYGGVINAGLTGGREAIFPSSSAARRWPPTMLRGAWSARAGYASDFEEWPAVRLVKTAYALPCGLPSAGTVAAPDVVNGIGAFPLLAAYFGCHHRRERTGESPCAGVSRSGRCWLPARSSEATSPALPRRARNPLRRHRAQCTLSQCRTRHRCRRLLFDGYGRTCRPARGLCTGHRLEGFPPGAESRFGRQGGCHLFRVVDVGR